jgi:predicted RNase H-like nuclease (RuvC/YqgF family)
VSISGDDKAEGLERQALTRLDTAVGELLAELERLRLRTRRAEARVRDVESLLRRFTRGEEDPGRLQTRIRELETENEALQARIGEGREGVDRLLARIRFVEEQK